MKKVLPLFLIPLLAYAAVEDPDKNDNMLLSQQGKRMFKQEQGTINNAVTKDITKQEYSKLKSRKPKNNQVAKEAAASAAVGAHERGSSDIMIVDSNVVAGDWATAFKALNSKNSSNITFILRDHTTISDVASIEPMPGGYLMLFTLKTVQGTKYRIIKTSDINSLVTK